MDALDFHEAPRFGNRRLRVGRRIAHRGLHGQTEHAATVVDMLDRELECLLPVSQDLGRAAAEVHQQPDLQRGLLVRPRRGRFDHRADQRQTGRSQQHPGRTRRAGIRSPRTMRTSSWNRSTLADPSLPMGPQAGITAACGGRPPRTT